MGQKEALFSDLKEISSLVKEGNDSFYLGVTLGLYARHYSRTHHFDMAQSYLNQAWTILDSQDLPSLQARLYNTGGVIEFFQQADQKAIFFFQKGLDACRRFGNLRDEARIMSNLGLLYSRRGQFAEAVQCHTHALQLHHKLKNYTHFPNVLCNLAEVYRIQGQLQPALQLYLKGLSIIQQTGTHDVMEIFKGNIGLLYCELDRFDDAHRYLNTAVDRLLERQIKGIAGIFMGGIAFTYLKQASSLNSSTLHSSANSIQSETGYQRAQDAFEKANDYFNSTPNFAAERAQFWVKWALLNYQLRRRTRWIKPALRLTKDVLQTESHIELSLLAKQLKKVIKRKARQT